VHKHQELLAQVQAIGAKGILKRQSSIRTQGNFAVQITQLNSIKLGVRVRTNLVMV